MHSKGSAATRAERLLGAYPHARPSAPPDDEEDLNEDDIFSTGNSSPVHRQLQSPPSPAGTASPIPRHHHHQKGFSLTRETSGILAALPDSPPCPNSHFFQKPAATASSSSSSVASSTSSSSSRLIPRPPQERVPVLQAAASFSRLHPQSAPVNVPVMIGRGRMRRGKGSDFDDVDEEEERGGGGEEAVGGMMMTMTTMLPPHEMVSQTHTPVVACSVLEGVGRTLKGRDLRQVRNAVWRRTGFLD